MALTKKYPYRSTIRRPQFLDDPLSSSTEQPEQNEQVQFIRKGVKNVHDTAFDLVKSGTHLLQIPPLNREIEDAQYLYHQQLINDFLLKASGLSSVQVPDAYDNLNAELRDFDKPAILKDEEFRRSIISISTAWNSLGVFRSDFIKNNNDKMCRNAFVAEVEKGFLDYIGSVEWDLIDTATDERVDSAYDFMWQPNPQQSFRDVIVPATRDLFRYDAGAIIKSFNRRMELIELHTYLGTEFWIEMDRVPQLISVPTNDNIGIRATEFTSEKTPGKEVLMQGWWSRGYAWRYWQRSQTGVYIPFTPSEVCYLALYKRSDDIYGTDYLKFLSYWVQFLIDSTVAAGKTFQNGMVPSIIFTHPNMYDINQIQTRMSQLRFDNAGPTRMGKEMHLINGETATTLAQHLHDMEWVEGQRWVGELIWGYFGFTPDEFVGSGDTNRATSYVKRNITKSRLLKPMLRYLENKINTEILPFLKGYKKTWKFHFIHELELDDKQKVAQTGAIKMGAFTAGLHAGIPARLISKIANDKELNKTDLDELDKARQEALMQQMAGASGREDDAEGGLEGQDQGRYGSGSEMYQPVNFSDYGQGGEGTEQRFGNKEEKEYQKASGDLRYAVDDVFYKDGKKIVITFANDKIAKAKVYVSSVADVPEGRSYKVGERGKLYYNTQMRNEATKRTKKKFKGGAGGPTEEDGGEYSGVEAPDIEGAEKVVKVSGDGVGIVAGIVDGKLVAQQLKNKETTAFLKKVLACGGGPDHPGMFLSCMKEFGKKSGLVVTV